MSRGWTICALVVMLGAPAGAYAQEPTHRLSAIELSLACAPPPRLSPPAPTALRLAGTQDVVARTIFGPRDLLVITGGSKDGLNAGQLYYVRRAPSYGGLSMARYTGAGQITQTMGWVRIVAVNATTAIATVEHACSVMTSGDYLEPFTEPSVPAAAERAGTPAELDFSSPAHIVFGDGERSSIAVGEFALVDRGSSAGTTVGSRLAIYRDVRMADMPLASVGEAVVISESPDVAVVRIVRARDAVYAGDYLLAEKR